MSAELEQGTTIQFATSAGVNFFVVLFNIHQLRTYYLHRPPAGTLPLALQHSVCLVSLFLCISHTLRCFSASFATYSAFALFSGLGSLFSTIFGSVIVFTITQNAYISLYLYSQQLPKWPFLLVFIFTAISFVVGSTLRISTNTEQYYAIFLGGMALYWVWCLLFGWYFYFRLVLSMNQRQRRIWLS
eukprot:TRINITY_DN18028_c0_g1_i1.p1 TRINITY_DN18028_c0_g1~~TRINITY_DN18028_c0_g1_i1.p1  ORF type:complete len:210 (-),score=23.83 TRINITY_DN18028_c0_g1_i1:97-657(-)